MKKLTLEFEFKEDGFQKITIPCEIFDPLLECPRNGQIKLYFTVKTKEDVADIMVASMDLTEVPGIKIGVTEESDIDFQVALIIEDTSKVGFTAYYDNV